MQSTRRLWTALGAVMLVSFGILGWLGREIYQQAPPIPTEVRTSHAQLLFAPGSVMQGDVVDACWIGMPQIPVVGNVHAMPMQAAEDLRADIKAQMQSRVRWTESVQQMVASGINTFVEAGSGEVLLGLIKRIEPSADRLPLGIPQDYLALES